MKASITQADYIKTGIAAATVYSIPLLLFFKNESAINGWLLYIGNIVFMLIVVVATIRINKKLHDETSITKMITVGLKLTFASTLLALCFMLPLFYIFGRRIIPSDTANNTYSSTLLMLSMNTILVNILMGSFAILLAALIYNQYPKNSKGEDIT